MALSKRVSLSRMEFTFVGGQVHPVAHLVVETVVEDGGVRIARQRHRAVIDVAGPALPADPKLAEVAQAEKDAVLAIAAEVKNKFGMAVVAQ